MASHHLTRAMSALGNVDKDSEATVKDLPGLLHKAAAGLEACAVAPAELMGAHREATQLTKVSELASMAMLQKAMTRMQLELAELSELKQEVATLRAQQQCVDRYMPAELATLRAKQQRVDRHMPSELMYLADVLDRQRDEISSLKLTNVNLETELEQVKHHPLFTTAKEEDTAGEDVCYEKPQSLYAYCVERLGAHDLSVLETLRVLVLLLFLSGSQFVLVFAFFDATWLLAKATSHYPAFFNAVAVSNFYQGKNVQHSVPAVNFVASAIAMFLLATGPLRSDALQTFFASQPVDRLLFRKAASHVHWSRWLCDVLLAVPLQCAWLIRSVLAPTMAALGTANAMASADSAVDIVLNSVAVGFIFELDDVMYPMMLNFERRKKYEGSPPDVGSPLVVPGSPILCERYATLLCAFDIGLMAISYCEWSLPDLDLPANWQKGYWQIATLMWLRGGVYAAASAHLGFRARIGKLRKHMDEVSNRSKSKSPFRVVANADGRSLAKDDSMRLLGLNFVRLLCASGVVLFSTAFAYKVVYQGVSQLLGWGTCLAEDSDMLRCLNSYSKSEDCAASTELQMGVPDLHTFSYGDEFWSMKTWGPVSETCKDAKEQARVINSRAEENLNQSHHDHDGDSRSV